MLLFGSLTRQCITGLFSFGPYGTKRRYTMLALRSYPRDTSSKTTRVSRAAEGLPNDLNGDRGKIVVVKLFLMDPEGFRCVGSGRQIASYDTASIVGNNVMVPLAALIITEYAFH